MPQALELIKPIYKPNIDFKPEILEERATIVHYTIFFSEKVRVWPTTYLIQEDGSRKKLLQVYNLLPFPEWTTAKDYVFRFTLVFEALDASCLVFDLFEDISEPYPFRVEGIKRNQTDVYVVQEVEW